MRLALSINIMFADLAIVQFHIRVHCNSVVLWCCTDLPLYFMTMAKCTAILC